MKEKVPKNKIYRFVLNYVNIKADLNENINHLAELYGKNPESFFSFFLCLRKDKRFGLKYK